MRRPLNILANVRVASPCPASWADMRGDDRVRFCEQCQLNVFNISELPAAEAERLILEKMGRLCIRLYRRADGTILTRDCPRGLAAARLRIIRLAAVSAAACWVLFAALGALAAGPRGSGRFRLRVYEPFTRVSQVSAQIQARLAHWWSPPIPTQVSTILGGTMAMPDVDVSRLNPAELADLDDYIHEMELRDPASMQGRDRQSWAWAWALQRGRTTLDEPEEPEDGEAID